jgi:hypothetical protein
VFERFTDRARRVVVLAQEEARLLNHNFIGTEHVLLGMLAEGEDIAAEVLASADISLDAARSKVEAIGRRGSSSPSGHIPFTPRAKKVLEYALREALQLGDSFIGTEHLLLATWAPISTGCANRSSRWPERVEPLLPRPRSSTGPFSRSRRFNQPPLLVPPCCTALSATSLRTGSPSSSQARASTSATAAWPSARRSSTNSSREIQKTTPTTPFSLRRRLGAVL